MFEADFIQYQVHSTFCPIATISFVIMADLISNFASWALNKVVTANNSTANRAFAFITFQINVYI